MVLSPPRDAGVKRGGDGRARSGHASIDSVAARPYYAARAAAAVRQWAPLHPMHWRRPSRDWGGAKVQVFQVRTSERTQLIEITEQVQRAVGASGAEDGVCLVYVPHTTAGVTVNENADPSVRRDILMELNKMVPFQDGYAHSEGNSAAHIKASLLGCSCALPVKGGRLALGTWQGIYLCEFDGPRSRQVWVRCI